MRKGVPGTENSRCEGTEAGELRRVLPHFRQGWCFLSLVGELSSLGAQEPCWGQSWERQSRVWGSGPPSLIQAEQPFHLVDIPSSALILFSRCSGAERSLAPSPASE